MSIKTNLYLLPNNSVSGDVAVGLTDEKGMDVPVKTTDNQDGTFTVEYEPKSPGKYTVLVLFADKEVPQSPIKVQVEPSIDVSKVKVVGLEPSKLSAGYVLLSFQFYYS